MLVAIATAFGVSSTLQAYWLSRLSGDMAWSTGDVAHLLALNLAYWYVPALLAPVIMAVATRYRLGETPWPLFAAVHVSGAAAYVVAHESVMTLIRWQLGLGRTAFDGCWACTARESLSQLDWLLMTYLFFVGLAHALLYRRESEVQALDKAQLHTRLVEAQMQSLQRQLKPHFLFNTLFTISALMRSDPAAADRMMDGLGALLRMTLKTSGVEQVPLKEELEALEKYLGIEQVRLGSRLEVHMRVDPETLDALVPYLLLQPLVENAIRHGIAPHARAGWVAIHAARSGERLQIDVIDSGDGVPPDRLGELQQGVGWSNTRARLEHLYKTAFEFTPANLAHGFRVKVSIPFRQDQSAGTPQTTP